MTGCWVDRPRKIDGAKVNHNGSCTVIDTAGEVRRGALESGWKRPHSGDDNRDLVFSM